MEAALLKDGFKRGEVVVAHPKRVERFIDEKTTIVGVNTMDPYSMKEIEDLMKRAERFLRTAEITLDGNYDSCVSRCYCAMF